MSSLPLFERVPVFSRFAVDDVCAHRSRGNPESEAAHEAIREGKERQHLRVLDYLRRCGSVGATCEQIAIGLGMPYPSASARLSELKHPTDGRAVKSGRRRPTTSGQLAAVIVLARYAEGGA